MQYKIGYVAFIDILGFSKYVSDENNASNTYNLFDFVNKICSLFNDSPSLNVDVSFFSDSIVITSEKIESLITPIYMAESFLKDELGLLFRGGIYYGKYFHKDGVTFGPAVVAAYQLESKANYSRIIFDKSITLPEDSIFYYPDIDGYTCLNPLSSILNEPILYGPEGPIYPSNNINEIINDHFQKERDKILSDISKNKNTSVVDKYIWRVKPFNYTCKVIANLPYGQMIYRAVNFTANENLQKLLQNQIITEDDILNC